MRFEGTDPSGAGVNEVKVNKEGEALVFSVSEQEIESAIRFVAHNHHKIIEGAAGVAVASLIKSKDMFKRRTVVIIICGSNIDIGKFKKVI